MAGSGFLDGLSKWVARGELRDLFDEVLDEHLQPACSEAGVSVSDLPKLIGDEFCRPLWGCAFNDLLSQELDDGSNIIDDYLKRRGWKEPVSTRKYLAALRVSVTSIYEVSAVTPGASFRARDLVRGGEPMLVTERTATRVLKEGDHIAARIMEVGSQIEMAGGILPLTPELSEYALQQLRRMADERRQAMAQDAGRARDDADPQPLDEAALYTSVLREAAPPISTIWLLALLKQRLGDGSARRQ